MLNVPSSNLFIGRKKVLSVDFLVLVVYFSGTNYYRGSFQEETGFPHLSALKVTAFLILSLLNCFFSSKISKEFLIIV